MRKIASKEIEEKVKELCMSANYNLGEDVIKAFKKGLELEESPVGKEILKALLENAEIARTEQMPICQDTGVAMVFVDIGEDVCIEGSIDEAINAGVEAGYKDGYLRKSICDPLTRQNTETNTPASIYYNIVPGDKLKITVSPKGGGCNNMGRVTMLKPADGVEGIKDFVIKRMSESGANPCPPVIVGVGIGGSLEKVAMLATEALLRPIGSKNPEPRLAALEEELLEKINNLGMGPQGLGGRFYAMAVHIKMFPTHIASLPVGVNVCCHASRHKEITI
ncbi:MAG: fumarate hydratase [Nitrospinota bacterium]|nr:fumarate hydratase [Nitrospinota bacterium]